MRVAELVLSGAFFKRDGSPDKMGQLLINAVNALIGRTGGILGQALGPLPEYTVATVPDAAANARCLIYVSDETDGAVVAFSDGSDWRRVTDRAVVS